MPGVAVVNQPGVFVVDSQGNEVGVVLDGSKYRLCVDTKLSDTDKRNQGCGSIVGSELRYEINNNTSLPASTGSFVNVYQITEESILYKVIMDVDSDNIILQVEIDGIDIFPNNFTFEDLEDLAVGQTGGGYKYNQNNSGSEFGLFQYDSNRWLWCPPCPIYINSNLKIKMKSSSSSTNKNSEKILAIRRSLV